MKLRYSNFESYVADPHEKLLIQEGTSLWRGVLLGGGGALECNLTGRCPFFKSLHHPFRKNIFILIPCFGIFRLQNSRKAVGKQ